MHIDELIKWLSSVRDGSPNSQVFIATSAQASRSSLPGMNGAHRLPVADNSCLGDEDGEMDSLFLVTVDP